MTKVEDFLVIIGLVIIIALVMTYEFLMKIVRAVFRLTWRLLVWLSWPLRWLGQKVWKWSPVQKVAVILAGLSFWWLSRLHIDRLVIHWPAVNVFKLIPPWMWIVGLVAGLITAVIFLLVWWFRRRPVGTAKAATKKSNPAPWLDYLLKSIEGLAWLACGLALAFWPVLVIIRVAWPAIYFSSTIWTFIISFAVLAISSFIRMALGYAKAEYNYHPLKSLLGVAIMGLIWYMVGQWYLVEAGRLLH